MVRWNKKGEEQNLLNALAREGAITKFTTPTSLKVKHKEFKDFSVNVIRNHLNIVKQKNGLFRKYNLSWCFLFYSSPFITVTNDDDADKEESNVAERPERMTVHDDDEEPVIETNATSTHNAPFLMEVYKENNVEKLHLALALPGGATGIRFDLSTSGTSLDIEYKWPVFLYQMDKLFRKIITKDVTLQHPRIESFSTALEKHRSNIDSAPICKIHVNLPIAVQTGQTTWSKTGMKSDDGSLILLADFSGLEKDYIKKEADSLVDFTS